MDTHTHHKSNPSSEVLDVLAFPHGMDHPVTNGHHEIAFVLLCTPNPLHSQYMTFNANSLLLCSPFSGQRNLLDRQEKGQRYSRRVCCAGMLRQSSCLMEAWLFIENQFCSFFRWQPKYIFPFFGFMICLTVCFCLAFIFLVA